MKLYFFKLTSQYGSDLALKCLDRESHRPGRTAIGERKAVNLIEYFAIFDSKFALAQPHDHFVRAARFRKNNDVFILCKRRHPGDLEFQIADLPTNGRQFERPWRSALDRLVDFDGVAGENQLPIVTPVRS